MVPISCESSYNTTNTDVSAKWTLQGGPKSSIFRIFSDVKNVINMSKIRSASSTLSQNTRYLLKNLTVAENQFQKTQNSHSRSCSRPLFENACSRRSDFLSFLLTRGGAREKTQNPSRIIVYFACPKTPQTRNSSKTSSFLGLVRRPIFETRPPKPGGANGPKLEGEARFHWISAYEPYQKRL